MTTLHGVCTHHNEAEEKTYHYLAKMNLGLLIRAWALLLVVFVGNPTRIGVEAYSNKHRSKGSGSGSMTVAAHERVERQDIYFAAFFPMTPIGSTDAKIGHGVMPAVRLAIKHINQSPNILKGYKLHMYWNDTQVSCKNEMFFLFKDEIPILTALYHKVINCSVDIFDCCK